MEKKRSSDTKLKDDKTWKYQKQDQVGFMQGWAPLNSFFGLGNKIINTQKPRKSFSFIDNW